MVGFQRLGIAALASASLWFFAASGALPGVSIAAAQDDTTANGEQDNDDEENVSASDTEQNAASRQAYVEGERAAQEGRWADAAELFRRAYEGSGVPAALFNLATALRALGQYRAARDAYNRILTRHPDLDETLRQQTAMLYAETATRIGHIELRELDPETRHQIRLDESTIPDDGSRPLTLDADAGRRALVVIAPEREPFVWEGEVDGAETIRLDVNLERAGRRPIRSPFLWGGVGAVLLGVGLSVGLIMRNNAQLSTSSDRVVHL